MMNDVVTALDLGNSKVTCLAASSRAGRMKIESFATTPCRGMRRGTVADRDEVAAAIDVVVRRVGSDLGDSIESLIVGISGTHTEGHSNQGLKIIVPRSRSISHQDVLEVINHSRSLVLPAEREAIQVIPREFRVDGQRDVRQPIGMSGGKLEVTTYIVSADKGAVGDIEQVVGRNSRRIEQMVLSSLASGVGVLTQDELEQGAMVVDIGAGTTDIAIFTSGSIAFAGTVPVGSGHVSSDISKLLKTTLEEGDRLKLGYGASLARLVPEKETVEVLQLDQPMARPMQRRVLCEIMESRMRELAVMVRQQVEKSGLNGSLSGGVILTGGGAQMAGTDKLFDEVLKHMRVRVAEPDLGPGLTPQPGLATAVGLARYGLQCQDDITPAAGNAGWKERVRGLFALLGAK